MVDDRLEYMNEYALEIPTLTTKRLRLQPLSMRHSRGMFETWRCAEVQKYSGPAQDAQGKQIPLPARTAEDSDRLIGFWLKAAQDGWGFRWAILLTQDNSFVGHIGFNSLKDVSEIAYHQNPEYWGKGLMTEAAEAAIRWRHSHGAGEIEAYIEPKNTGSIALALRLGMVATNEFSVSAQRYLKLLRQPLL